MIGLLIFLLRLLVLRFKPKLRLEAENAALRQQVSILQRKLRGRVQLTNGNRLFFLQLSRWFPSILKAMTIVQPDTLVRWHREGFRCYWRWKSRNLGGRPAISEELRALIGRMSLENPVVAQKSTGRERLVIFTSRAMRSTPSRISTEISAAGPATRPIASRQQPMSKD